MKKLTHNHFAFFAALFFSTFASADATKLENIRVEYLRDGILDSTMNISIQGRDQQIIDQRKPVLIHTVCPHGHATKIDGSVSMAGNYLKIATSDVNLGKLTYKLEYDFSKVFEMRETKLGQCNLRVPNIYSVEGTQQGVLVRGETTIITDSKSRDYGNHTIRISWLTP